MLEIKYYNKIKFINISIYYILIFCIFCKMYNGGCIVWGLRISNNLKGTDVI